MKTDRKIRNVVSHAGACYSHALNGLNKIICDMTTEELIAHSTEIVIPNTDVSAPIRSAPNQKELARQDITLGFQHWYIWLTLAYQDIKLRYRRSVLGPFWLTISMGVTVYSMGFLYAHLFHTDLQQYYPFLVSGMLCWTLISSGIIELTDAFMLSESLIKQIKMPYTLYIHRTAARNIIIFFHNFLVMVPIYLLFSSTAKINLQSLLIIPGLLILYINMLFYGTILAVIGSRYRDISQVIKSLVQVIFFITPVMWSPAILPEKSRLIVYANPFYSFLEIIRAPLLGKAPTLFNLGVTLTTTVIGACICYKLLVRYRARIIYWL